MGIKFILFSEYQIYYQSSSFCRYIYWKGQLSALIGLIELASELDIWNVAMSFLQFRSGYFLALVWWRENLSGTYLIGQQKAGNDNYMDNTVWHFNKIGSKKLSCTIN